jgi:hypothetical protein
VYLTLAGECLKLAAMRVASFNVENLFERARPFGLVEGAAGTRGLRPD